MRFGHSAALRAEFPELVAGVLRIDGITADADVSAAVDRYTARGAARLDGATESELPEIQAWRRAFSRMGLKPTQYRCASEALLRRLRNEGALRRIHPLVDLGNAISLAFALPVAPLDLANVAGDLEVRHADGSERYETFGGEIEQPAAGEVVFADDEGWAHARRWTNRQSGRSAVRPATTSVLIVIEGLHATAGDDVPAATAALAEALREAWDVEAASAVLTPASPSAAFS